MVSILYNENEIIERKADVHVMGNGTVTAGAKYIDNDDVQIDIIIIHRKAQVQKVLTQTVMPVETPQPIAQAPQHQSSGLSMEKNNRGLILDKNSKPSIGRR